MNGLHHLALCRKGVLNPGLESQLTDKLEIEHQSTKGGGRGAW